MAHGNDLKLYRNLGEKIDGLSTRAPWNEAFSDLLKTLFTPEEAEFIVKMPYGLATLSDIETITKYEKTKLQKMLDSLCSQGLVIDMWIRDEYRYMPSPMVVGIFELVMMRTGNSVGSKQWAEALHRYMHGDNAFYAANAAHKEKVFVMRTLVHEEAVLPEAHVEVLDYEKASAIIEESNRFAIGLCSCRHEKMHIGEKKCDVPLDTCSSFGVLADFGIRRGFAKEVSKAKMLENLARSKELKLALTADNVKQRVNFICHCCKCCCNLMLGITKHGYPNTLVTSSFISQANNERCTGCTKCVKACPAEAITVIASDNPKSKTKKAVRIDEDICLGCGVCALVCDSKAVGLTRRKQRVIHPETTFERVILSCLERGTLQNQIFIDPNSVTQAMMRGFVGGFLKLSPVKKALMSDMLRSTFLASMRAGVKMQGRSWLLDV